LWGIFDGAAADKFANDGVPGNNLAAGGLFAGQARDGFEQVLDALVADAGVQEAGVGREIFGARQVAIRAGKERFQRREVEGESAVDDMIGQAAQGDDAEQFAGADVVPVQDGQQRAVVAVLDIAQHAPQQAHVGELGAAAIASVAFGQHVLRFDVEAELRGGGDAFRDRRVKAVEAIEQENLAGFKPDVFARDAAAFFEAVDGFFDGFAGQQAGEVAVEQLDIQRFGGLVVAVVDPVGRMLDQRPEIVIEVEHEEPQSPFLEPFGQFDGGGGFAGGAGAADPHHAELVAAGQAPHDFFGRFVERLLVKGEGFLHQGLDFAASDDFVEAGHGVAAALPIPRQRLLHPRPREAVAGELVRRDGAFPQPVTAPPVAFVGVGGVLEAVAAQRVEDFVLDDFDGGREIGDQVVRVGVQAHDHRVGQKPGDGILAAVRRKEGFIDAGDAILFEAADGSGGVEDRPPDAGVVELYQGAVALLDFNNAVLDGHVF